MKFKEINPEQNYSNRLIESFEKSRIGSDDAFRKIYSDYSHDMERTENLGELYRSNSPEVQLGKIAEALVFSLLQKHKIRNHLEFRATSEYDDYFHGADVVVEPKGAVVQALAAIDITINQEDIKGKERLEAYPESFESRPVGLDAKLSRVRRYTDYLSDFEPSEARNLKAWMDGGGLHQPRTSKNEIKFQTAERLFLMKYYKTPDSAKESGKTGYVIGGPQAIISIDTMFINQALQNNEQAKEMIGDLALLEFVYCIQAELKYLKKKVETKKDRNVFFDTHYTKIQAWVHIFEQSALENIIDNIIKKHQRNPDFIAQIKYYGEAFQKAYR